MNFNNLNKTEQAAVIKLNCQYFTYQEDMYGDIALTHCINSKNKLDVEGNCTHNLCPLNKPKEVFPDGGGF